MLTGTQSQDLQIQLAAKQSKQAITTYRRDSSKRKIDVSLLLLMLFFDRVNYSMHFLMGQALNFRTGLNFFVIYVCSYIFNTVAHQRRCTRNKSGPPVLTECSCGAHFDGEHFRQSLFVCTACVSSKGWVSTGRSVNGQFRGASVVQAFFSTCFGLTLF